MSNIVFEKIKIHNFLSFGDAELDFRNKGYVLVSGTNKNPKDNAVSNGSGKSSIWSAISWTLTGETIQGVSTNIVNINFIEEGCWVELTFKINEDEYVVTRYKDKKGSDLKIFINKEDKSGDGIRKSEAILSQYLPDITSSLIGSVIILGQGLPHRFTNNTPAGRKEVLEKLSKSDFMIEDIKTRIAKRSEELSTVKRSYEDELIKLDTQLNMYNEEVIKETNKLSSYLEIPDFDSEINSKELKLKDIEIAYDYFYNQSINENKKQSEINESMLKIISAKSNEIASLKDNHNTIISDIKINMSKLETEISHIKSEILKIDSIKDVCPTCNQKLPHVHKNDTTELRVQLSELVSQHDIYKSKEKTITKTHDDSVIEINKKYATQEEELKSGLYLIKTNIGIINLSLNSAMKEKNNLSSEILQLKNKKTNFETNKKQIEESILSINTKILSIKDKILYINRESNILDSHILAIDKMSSLVKRDFRGFLLTHIIDFINVKAKEYCSYVFETDEIEFELNGNSIDILYCGKDYENLSGGEKQKVDLIIQFSIRDMLSNYLNFSSNILVLDEITDNLDSKGSDKVVSLISNKLTDVESVFIITHHTELLRGLFEREISVEKDENGVSKIKQ